MENALETIGAEVQASEPLSVEIQTVKCERLEISLNIDVLKQFCNEVGALVDEARITFSPMDGLRAKVVDPAHIAMVETGIATEIMDQFHYSPYAVSCGENGEIAEIGLGIEKLQSYLKSLKLKDSILKLTVDWSKSAAGQLTIESPTGQRVMSLIDVSGISDPKVPVLNLPIEIEVQDPKAFRGLLRQAETISDHIAVSYETATDSVWIDCEGDLDKMHAQVVGTVLQANVRSENQVDLITGKMQVVAAKVTRSLFPLEYFKDFARAIPQGFKLTFGHDYPLKIGYGRTTYLLAPRIESGD